MTKVLNDKILDNVKLADGIFKMTILSEYIAQNAVPGQFVNVKCTDGIDPLLRRPISICNVDAINNTYDIVYQVKGKGTELMSKMPTGSYVDVLGPLGKGFDTDKKYKKIAVVGGGIGVFPLLYLLNKSKATTKSAYLGFRNTNLVVLREEFKNTADVLKICTDDGSEGFKGFVPELLEKDLADGNFDVIYTCGPTRMLQLIVNLAEKYKIPCQVSLEEHMGCGIGACLVCACKTKYGDDWKYSHVCKDGPIFWSNEIIIEN